MNADKSSGCFQVYSDLSDCEAADIVKHKTPNTMELLYVWIENYKNIKKQGFNFSPKHWFDFEYEEEDGKVIGGTLHHKERNTNYPENFFGENISNVTAIVGKNGSGKSNLLKCIYSHLDQPDKELLAIFKSKDQFILKPIQSISIYNEKDFEILSRDINCIFYSPHLNSNSYLYNFGTSYSIASGTLLHYSIKELLGRHELKGYTHPFAGSFYNDKSPDVNFQFLAFRKNELFKQISFAINYKNQVPFRLPEQLIIRINHHNFDSLIIPDKLTKLISRDSSKSFYYNLISAINRVIIFHFIENYLEEDNTEQLINSITKFISSKTTQIELNQYLLKLTYGYINYPSLDAIKQLEEKFKNSHFNIQNTYCTISINDNILNEVNELLLNIGRDSIFESIFEYDWRDLSDGEYNYLAIFSRINHIVKINPRIQFDLILIDEPENQFHPQWQKQFLNIFLEVNDLLLKRSQIITSSHSPFIVSDLPKDNIIFLNKNKDGECEVKQPEDMTHTFGANIHSLYRNSFFLENGLMGEFAKGKIDQVIQDLNQQDPKSNISDERKKEILFIIEQIGEPILQEKLKKKYKEIFEPLNRRIEELRLELAQLEALQNLKS